MSICVECGKEYEFDARDILMCISGMCVECIRGSLHKHEDISEEVGEHWRGVHAINK